VLTKAWARSSVQIAPGSVSVLPLLDALVGRLTPESMELALSIALRVAEALMEGRSTADTSPSPARSRSTSPAMRYLSPDSGTAVSSPATAEALLPADATQDHDEMQLNRTVMSCIGTQQAGTRRRAMAPSAVLMAWPWYLSVTNAFGGSDGRLHDPAQRRQVRVHGARARTPAQGRLEVQLLGRRRRRACTQRVLMSANRFSGVGSCGLPQAATVSLHGPYLQALLQIACAETEDHEEVAFPLDVFCPLLDLLAHKQPGACGVPKVKP